MIKKNVLFFGGVGLMTIVGLSLIVHSCSHDDPVVQQPAPQASAQIAPQQQLPPPTVIYSQAPPQQEDHFWRDMAVYHMLFGGSRQTTVYQPVPVYHPAPAPVVNKTVQNVTINQTVNHVSAPAAPVPAAKPVAQPVKAAVAPTPAPVAAPAPPKASWWASPAQVVKASTNYPKAQNTNTGSYSMKSSGYSGYTSRSTYSSGSSFRSSGRR